MHLEFAVGFLVDLTDAELSTGDDYEVVKHILAVGLLDKLPLG